LPSKALLIFQRKRIKNKEEKNKEIKNENSKKKKQNAYGKPPAAAITPPTPKVSFLENVDIDA
jgi:hypothetical protein